MARFRRRGQQDLTFAAIPVGAAHLLVVGHILLGRGARHLLRLGLSLRHLHRAAKRPVYMEDVVLTPMLSIFTR